MFNLVFQIGHALDLDKQTDNLDFLEGLNRLLRVSLQSFQILFVLLEQNHKL